MGERAQRLAKDLKVDTLSGPARVLAEEAVLITERLERLDATLQGEPDAWLKIVECLPDTVAEVIIDKPLQEVRQQGLALKAIISELTKVMGAAEPAAKPASTADEVARKRNERRKEAGLA